MDQRDSRADCDEACCFERGECEALMRAQKDSFEPGTATIVDFFYWIDERHRIYLKRQMGMSKPWTDDPILRDWKFTNVFRQLDRGTVMLRGMLHDATVAPEHREGGIAASIDEVVWNIMWYRLFNLDTHALEMGWVSGSQRSTLYEYLRGKAAKGEKIFTSAHMTTGVCGEPKVETYIRACEDAWDRRWHVTQACQHGTLEAVFHALLPGYMIGRFVAYEMACDLRFVPALWPELHPRDVLGWANMGPGAARGLARLGLLPTLRFTAQAEGVAMMQKLHGEALAGRVSQPVLDGSWPFELREIEHSLCEFDKYQRVKRGEGQARMKFNGRA